LKAISLFFSVIFSIDIDIGAFPLPAMYFSV
jgi:hypothetical protein